ncbi:fimbrial protein [Serratia nevei]|uniref:fimbrial protein n=1 Tax=Serratia TaxID=613 RepID=UPI0018D620DA|nr:fimbrial protein [Serratia marcescens]MBH2871194.1 type 1 fimbrial protein [Serratia marcescens]MBI6126341.1 type 1 fimbrial protein [Serratia marcescens]MBN5185119.1 type 1 fimbrial protein [Serratia marcescens]MBN5194901.1 type 1 fimbrial protein [Serratia marcescens]MBN5301078.1 type 1 fimbrial protein [Serratia marcescens]
MRHLSGKLMIFCMLASSLLGTAANAAIDPQIRGRVNMQGAIFDAACAIATQSREQIIDIDIVPTAEIIRGGEGSARPFSIELINCVITKTDNSQTGLKNFQMIFDGDADGQLFRVQGEARGIALQIYDHKGNIATPGAPLPYGDILASAMQLNYSLRVVSNNRPLQAGAYSSAVRFKLNYY